MALTQVVELQYATNTKVLVSKSDTIESEWNRLRLKHHREEGGIGLCSIGHISRLGNFVGPNGSYFKG